MSNYRAHCLVAAGNHRLATPLCVEVERALWRHVRSHENNGGEGEGKNEAQAQQLAGACKQRRKPEEPWEARMREWVRLVSGEWWRMLLLGGEGLLVRLPAFLSAFLSP